jgi:glycosyltransferase involved in cell wall biosynthesis
MIYSAADIFVLPALQDNFPNTALEALACGLPVIAFDAGGVPEIVRDGLTGLLVEPANPQALASAIEELVGNPERRKEMSANCRRIAVQEYALEVQARRYSDLYSSLLQVTK